MLTLIQIELFKIFKKWRSYIGLIAIAVLVPLIQIAFLIEGNRSVDFMTRNLQSSFIFVGNFLNGYFISYFILNSLTVHIPFLVALVAGDLLAGEATAGTYRIILTRPISRLKLVTSKFLAGILYTFILVFWMALVSLGLGIILFGVGELIVLSGGGIVIFERADVLWRFLAAFGFAALSMSLVASLAFLLSSLVENSIGPIITTMAIIIAFIIISAIDIDIFRAIKPYLFTNYMMSWRSFFDSPMDTSDILKSLAVILGHILGFFGLSYWFFRRKDILT
ncbi:MAG TPA: ABC transporter permease subunit [Ignavibacteriaceae bacterium]|nr:ABC transporter permease subunit [Ignavibacteriaceae bacterium]